MQTLVERGCGLAVHKGYRGGLFVDCFAEWASSEADSDIGHEHARVAALAGMVALGRLHPGSHGEHRGVLEAGRRPFGRGFGDRGGQCAACQESSGP